jgi:hypothetical protein
MWRSSVVSVLACFMADRVQILYTQHPILDLQVEGILMFDQNQKNPVCSGKLQMNLNRYPVKKIMDFFLV